jgi:DNA-binding CsgD family transcriptional regulator
MKLPPQESHCALVLSSVPLICAGVTAVINRATAGRLRTLNGPWEERQKLLPGLVERLQLVVADPGTTFTSESLSRLMQLSGNAPVIIALPGMAVRIRDLSHGSRLHQIPVAARLDEWLRVIQRALGEPGQTSDPRLRPLATGADSREAGSQARRPDRVTLLTKRQMEVYELLSQGLSNSEIAERIGTTVGTAKLHVAAVMEALQATRRIDIVLRRATSAQVNTESDLNDDSSSNTPQFAHDGTHGNGG